MALLIKIKNFLADALFPSFCVVCDKYLAEKPEKDFSLCDGCFEKIEVNSGFFCSKCNKRIPVPNFPPESDKKTLGKKLQTVFAKNCCKKIVIAAPCSYDEEAVRKIIYSLKYKRAKRSVKPLGFLIKKYAEKTKLVGMFESHSEKWLAIPVPLHPSRKRERGFNQAEDVAGIVGAVLGVAVEKKCFIRIKKTKSQITIRNKEERRKNVDESFFVVEPNKIIGKNIILIDDVFTTGATMQEAAQTLKEAGARKIVGFVVAKA